ncbi:MAG: thioredoxin family protein [Bacilli bacterium]|nr:thioredoxin family protein [Bacilli bacterium]
MKKKILIIATLICCLITTGCTRTITYKTFIDRINNKESMIVEVIQTGCSHCEKFEPVFSKFTKENNLSYVKLNISNISDDDYNYLNTHYGVSGTPTVLIIKNGKELSDYRISGEVSTDVLKDTFKKAGYIK